MSILNVLSKNYSFPRNIILNLYSNYSKNLTISSFPHPLPPAPTQAPLPGVFLSHFIIQFLLSVFGHSILANGLFPSNLKFCHLKCERATNETSTKNYIENVFHIHGLKDLKIKAGE